MASPEDGALVLSRGVQVPVGLCGGSPRGLRGVPVPGVVAVSRRGWCRNARRWLRSIPAGRCSPRLAVRDPEGSWGQLIRAWRRCGDARGAGGNQCFAPVTPTGAREMSARNKGECGLRPSSQPPGRGPPPVRRPGAPSLAPRHRSGLRRAAPPAPAPAEAGLRSAGGGAAGARHPRDRGANQGAVLALLARLRPPLPGHGEVRRGKSNAVAGVRGRLAAPHGDRELLQRGHLRAFLGERRDGAAESWLGSSCRCYRWEVARSRLGRERLGEREPPVRALTVGRARVRPRAGQRGRVAAGGSLASSWVRCPCARVAEREPACLVCGVSVREVPGAEDRWVGACLEESDRVPEDQSSLCLPPWPPGSVTRGCNAGSSNTGDCLLPPLSRVSCCPVKEAGDNAFCRRAAASLVYIAVFSLLPREEWWAEGELKNCDGGTLQCGSGSAETWGSSAGAGSTEALGEQEAAENPSKEETGCMEKEVVWRKGGEQAGGWKENSGVRATEGSTGVRGKCGFS